MLKGYRRSNAASISSRDKWPLPFVPLPPPPIAAAGRPCRSARQTGAAGIKTLDQVNGDRGNELCKPPSQSMMCVRKADQKDI